MVPLALKLAYTAMAAGVLAVYWVRYGWRNYLWFSDVALIGLVPALWFESAFLTSTLAVGVILLEAFWNVSFFVQLATGWRVSGLTDYMFERERPLFLRALSLFHVFLLPVMLYLLAKLGYDAAGLPAMVVLGALVLTASYLLTGPAKNINWVHGFAERGRFGLTPARYFAALFVAYPVLVFVPTHFLLLVLFG